MSQLSYPSQLTVTLEHFEAAEANLVKLERVSGHREYLRWMDFRRLQGDGLGGHNDD